jgi:hypothetical protein
MTEQDNRTADEKQSEERFAEMACEALEGIEFQTAGDEIEAVNQVAATLRNASQQTAALREELERLKQDLRDKEDAAIVAINSAKRRGEELEALKAEKERYRVEKEFYEEVYSKIKALTSNKEQA